MAALTLHPIADARPSRAMRAGGAVCALLLLCGFAGALMGAFDLQAGFAVLLPAALCGAGAIAIGGFLAGRGSVELRFYLGAIVVLAVLCVALSESVLAGGAQLANDLIVRIGERTQIYALPYTAGSNADLALLLAFAALVLGSLCSICAQHGGVVVPVVLACAAVVACAFGWVPIGWWICPVALGVLGCALARSSLIAQARGHGSYGAVIAAALALCLVVAGIAALLTQGTQVDVGAAQAVLEDLSWRIRYGDASFAMPEGRLNNIGPLEASGQVALTVDVEQPTYEYLRGFVGERYEDGAWSALPSAAVMDNRAALFWLSADGFSCASQLAQAAEASAYPDADLASIAVDYGDVRKPYAYIPYAYANGMSMAETTDLAQARLGDAAAQRYTFDAGLTRKAYLLQKQLEQMQADNADDLDDAQGNADAQKLRAYLDDEGAYRSFVYDNYTFVPNDVRDTFASLYGPAQPFTAEQAKLVVQSALSDTVAYDADQSTDNGDAEFVSYFLTEQRSGYSVHYATAAALLLRYYGVPARYVEGYVLDTAAMEEASPGSYALTEAQAHAWAEYYLDGVGWIPFDVTPGWGDAGYYETTDQAELVEESQNWSVGEASDDAPWSPPENQQEQTADEEPLPSPLFEALDVLNLSWPWVLIGFLVALLAACVVRDALLHMRLRRFLEQSCASGDASALFSYAVLLAHACGGVEWANEPYAHQADKVERAGLCAADSFACAALANEAYLFGPADAPNAEDDCRSAEGIGDVVACINAIKAGLRDRTSVIGRFVQRHVRCLW